MVFFFVMSTILQRGFDDPWNFQRPSSVPQDLPAGYMNTIFLDPSLLLTLQKALLAGNLRRITLRMPAL